MFAKIEEIVYDRVNYTTDIWETNEIEVILNGDSFTAVSPNSKMICRLDGTILNVSFVIYAGKAIAVLLSNLGPIKHYRDQSYIKWDNYVIAFAGIFVCARVRYGSWGFYRMNFDGSNEIVTKFDVGKMLVERGDYLNFENIYPYRSNFQVLSTGEGLTDDDTAKLEVLVKDLVPKQSNSRITIGEVNYSLRQIFNLCIKHKLILKHDNIKFNLPYPYTSNDVIGFRVVGGYWIRSTDLYKYLIANDIYVSKKTDKSMIKLLSTKCTHRSTKSARNVISNQQ